VSLSGKSHHRKHVKESNALARRFGRRIDQRGHNSRRHCDYDEWRTQAQVIKTVNLKSDMPSVQEALQRLDREIAVARQVGAVLLKVIHGYGSSGAGGDIRISVQRRLHELAEGGQIRGCIFGENWSKSDDATWRLLRAHSALKNDADLGRRNRGITIVWL
jgi:asparagine synthetase A